jgi:hypothetical protein
MLGNLFNNPMIKNAAFGSLKKFFAEDGVSLVVVKADESKPEGFDIEVLKGKFHIVPDADFKSLITPTE